MGSTLEQLMERTPGRRLMSETVGITRVDTLHSGAQAQTEAVFGYKWKQRSTFESPAVLTHVRDWLNTRYGPVNDYPWIGEKAIVLDAGCGAGMAALEYFRPVLPNIRYVGVDISEAVDVARQRFAEHGCPGEFMQCDMMDLPFRHGSVDVLFSEGALHHTDSTFGAMQVLVPLLRSGGHFMFYVYRRKGPIREFTDDYVRQKLQGLPPAEAWAALMPLTRLGKALGELHIEVDVPEAVELLGIPAGKIDVQRLFYWNIVKAFYRPDMTLDEMAHVNFDWFGPRNAHRQSIEEVRDWCRTLNLSIEREVVEDAGITIVARKN